MQTIIQAPELADGETYIATLFDAVTQTGHHLILLPGDSERAPWQEQIDWAKSIGGELPTRPELALLYASHKDLFKEDWYWSNEQHAADPHCAWYQIFGNGTQYHLRTGSKLRARAVRRLAI